MISSTLQTQEKNTTISNEREIEEDGNSGQVTLQTDNKVEKREGGDFQRTSTAQCLVNCAAI
jgi:hypothetical protein